MPFQDCPGIAQFNLRYSSLSDYQENVYHLLTGEGTTWDSTSLSDAANNLADWDENYLASCRSTEFGLFQITATDLSSAGGAQITNTYASDGSRVGGAFPESVTIAVKWTTGLSGRSFRGRTYHIGLVLDDVEADRVKSSVITELFNAYHELLMLGMDNDAVPVVLSRIHNKAPRAEGIGTPITGVGFTDSFVDVQRRRLPQHNRHR